MHDPYRDAAAFVRYRLKQVIAKQLRADLKILRGDLAGVHKMQVMAEGLGHNNITDAAKFCRLGNLPIVAFGECMAREVVMAGRRKYMVDLPGCPDAAAEDAAEMIANSVARYITHITKGPKDLFDRGEVK